VCGERCDRGKLCRCLCDFWFFLKTL